LQVQFPIQIEYLPQASHLSLKDAIRQGKKKEADLDHGLAEDVNERLALEARGGEARGYDPHRAAAEPARPPVKVCRGSER